jgi:hypothetical protein
VALAALVLALVPASDCRTCSDTGRAPCPELASHSCPPGTALHCSIAADCETCRGLATVACPRCEHPEPGEDAERRSAEQAWRESTRSVEVLLGRALAHGASTHFHLTWDVPRLELDRRNTLDLHAGLHLYLDRLEALHERFRDALGASEEDFLAPTAVYVWTRRDDQEKASAALTRQPSATESRLMGAAPVVSLFYDKAWLHEEFELHQALVHQVTHCLLSNVWDGIWPGNIRAGWLDEGLAHAFEIELFERPRHYCFVESDTIRDLASGSWEVRVRKAVDRDGAPGLLGLCAKNTLELTLEERVFTWSYVDFVRRAYPQRLGPLARALKARTPLTEAAPAILEVSAFDLEPRWKAFVLEHYARKEPRRRR